MSIKKLFIFTILILSYTSLFAQKAKTAKILDQTYSLNYDKASNLFTMCQKVTPLNKDCVQKMIVDDNVFVFQEKLKKALEKQVDAYEFKIFGKDLTLANFNTIDYNGVTFTLDPSQLANVDDEVTIKLDNAPKDFPEFKLKTTAAGVYELSNKDVITTPIQPINNANIVTTTPAFIQSIQGELDNNKDEIATFYASKVKQEFIELLQDLYNTTITKGTDYVFLATELLNNAATPVVKESLNFYILLEDSTFHIKVCIETDESDCKKITDFNTNVSESEFIDTMTSAHQLFAKGDDLNKAALGKIYLLIKSKISSKAVAKDKKAFEDDFKGKIAELESGAKTYSGQFVLKNKVNLYEVGTVNKIDKKGNVKKNKDGTVKTKRGNVLNESVYLLIDSLNIRIFNNRADNLTIVGKLSNDPENTLTLTNSTYSLPLREFRNKKETNSLIDKNGKTYRYRYDDVLDYLPYNKYNNAVRNGDIKVKAKDTVKVAERKIGDYFTGIFFSDILGLNSNNGNSLITAEGRIRIPWHLRNWGRSTFIDNITAYASVNLVSGLEDSSRKITVDDTIDPDETSVANSALFNSNNFNLLVNNNIDAGISITPYTFEWKGASTFIHLRYGLRFLRTGVEYNLKEQVDTVVNGVPTVQENLLEERSFQVYSIGQEAELNFEIRPQSSVGADVTLGLNWFRATGTNKNDVNFSTINNTPNLKLMTNIYAFTDSEDSNSGIYVRLGGHYNLGNYKVFPQLMVGYATNLSSFVNKFGKK